jgi:hypothetical protein
MSEQVEERLAILEAEVAQLKQQLAVKTSDNSPWWDKIVGSFANDPAYEEAMKLGREYRQSLRANSAEADGQ